MGRAFSTHKIGLVFGFYKSEEFLDQLRSSRGCVQRSELKY